MHSSSNGPLSIFGVLPSQCMFNKLAFGLKLQASLVFFLAYVRSIFFFKLCLNSQGASVNPLESRSHHQKPTKHLGENGEVGM